jgi:hypothetical protein
MFESEDWSKTSIYSEVVNGHANFLACFRTNQYKLLWDATPDTFQLFNVIDDPDERQDLADILPDELIKMKSSFLSFLGYSIMDDLKPIIKAEIDEKMKERMKALGYIK